MRFYGENLSTKDGDVVTALFLFGALIFCYIFRSEISFSQIERFLESELENSFFLIFERFYQKQSINRFHPK